MSRPSDPAGPSLLVSWRSGAIAALCLAPLLSLAVNALAWLSHGIDLPFNDDFRAFELDRAGSLDPRDLFAPSNDTLYPVGLAIDALVQRAFAGNSVLYQFLSMLGLLGGLLALQWRLITTAIADRLVAASAFALTVFMIQPGSYWGLQNLAYHQGLPILFLLMALVLIVDRRWAAAWGIPAVIILGLLAGFSYISGAFTGVAVATVLVTIALTSQRDRALLHGGAALFAAALVAAISQAWVILAVQQGRIHDPTTSWALPTDLDFWIFMLGKIGRALAIPTDHPGLAMVVVMVVVTLLIAMTVRFALRLIRGQVTAANERAAAIFVVTLVAMVLAYLALLSAGRANLRSAATVAPLDVFVFSFQNFYHFFWATLLAPWILVALVVTFGRRAEKAAPLMAAAVVALAIAGGVMDHPAYFRDLEARRMDSQVSCLQHGLEQTGPIPCPFLASDDFTPTLIKAIDLGASFARYFPIKPIPFGDRAFAPLFTLSSAPAEQLRLVNLALPVRTEDGFSFAAASDPILIIDLPPGSLTSCLRFEVALRIQAAGADGAEMFARRAGQPDFAAPPTAAARFDGDGFATVYLAAHSRVGFGDSVRIDPVTSAQAFVIRDLELRCRYPRGPAP